MTDDHFMRMALDRAEMGRYTVSPNPMVGCIIVRDDAMIGEGWHHKAGEPHAEIEAMNDVQGDVRGATMYVTLEPCAHRGRTGPCADAVIRAGIKRVVVAMTDPFEEVNGKGLEKLRAADIDVTAGVLESEARTLNEKFVHGVTRKMPFVLLKAAMTLDGKLATVARESQWITSHEAREKSLALREEYDAILVGGGTVKADNPRLTRRLGWNRAANPWRRVILDRDRIVPADANVLTDGDETIHITDDVDLEALLRDLYSRGVTSLLVEGGAFIHSELIRRELWQKMILFVAPMIVGGGDAPALLSGAGVERLTDAHRFRFDRSEFVGRDLMITAYS